MPFTTTSGARTKITITAQKHENDKSSLPQFRFRNRPADDNAYRTGKKIEMPPIKQVGMTFKKAEKYRGKEAKQLELSEEKEES